jgi:hypothetical protein
MLTGNEARAAVDRILAEEVRDPVDTTPPEGEVLTGRESYGVHVLRRDDLGRAWIGDWQIKACLKQAASRLGIFVQTRGTKGDLVEMGCVHAHGLSLDGDPSHVLLLRDGKPYTDRQYIRVAGHISGPSGSRSIQYDAEIAPAGCTFYFAVRFGPLLSEEMIVTIIALAQNNGLGSGRSFEAGKFRVDKMTVHCDVKPKTKESKAKI